MEELKVDFLTNVVFILIDEGEIETNRFFRRISELAKILDKKLDKFYEHPSIYLTASINMSFRMF